MGDQLDEKFADQFPRVHIVVLQGTASYEMWAEWPYNFVDLDHILASLSEALPSAETF